MLSVICYCHLVITYYSQFHIFMVQCYSTLNSLVYITTVSIYFHMSFPHYNKHNTLLSMSQRVFTFVGLLMQYHKLAYNTSPTIPGRSFFHIWMNGVSLFEQLFYGLCLSCATAVLLEIIMIVKRFLRQVVFELKEIAFLD